MQLDYEKTAVTTGYQWCGSFIAAHYHLDASFAFVSDKKKKGGGKAPVARANGNTYLASTDKSYDYFNYAGEWAGAYLRDPAAPSDAAAAAAYVPLRAYHAAHGGERGWLPVETWKSNPLAVVRPGMVLFVKATPRYKHGAHMIFVDRVESDGAGGWVVHTVEGNAPGAKTAPGRYTIGARGDTVIVATARPALSDFDAHLEMVDADVYRQKLKEEAA
ncbi:MAG: hypothetical protein H6745_16435 [Deltaproteobacteria bacterium]|nr:hypothetical protein [Deltaproteobacteria bacterium]